jgi:hypothetical protein
MNPANEIHNGGTSANVLRSATHSYRRDACFGGRLMIISVRSLVVAGALFGAIMLESGFVYAAPMPSSRQARATASNSNLAIWKRS